MRTDWLAKNNMANVNMNQKSTMSAYYMQLCEDDKRRYKDKLIVQGKTFDDPYVIAESSWDNDVSRWPSVEFGDIWNYLINTPGMYTAENMKAYKSMDGYNFFVSGHVQQIMYRRIEGTSVCLLKATVIPSQKVSNKRDWHKCWICVDNNKGYVVSAHCSCKAGVGETCSHIAAVLFKVEAAVKMNLNDPSKTSVACVWNKYYREKVTAEPVKDMSFSRPRFERRRKRIQKAKPVCDDDSFDEDAAFRELKRLCPSACILTKDDSDTDTASEDDEIPPVLTRGRTLDASTLSSQQLERECQNFLNDFAVTESQSKNLEVMTRSQAECALWTRQRVGRITASVAHEVKSMRNDTDPKKFVQKIMKYRDSDLSAIPSVNYGVRNERIAKKKYFEVARKEHDNFAIRDCGLVVDTVFPLFAASPDGVRSCSCHGEGLIEVKCSYKHRLEQVSDIPSIDREFYLEKDTLTLKTTHKHYTQVQFQMYVAGKTFSDFVVYTDKGIFYQTIYYNPEFVRELIDKCSTFAFQYIVPEILTQKLRNTQ